MSDKFEDIPAFPLPEGCGEYHKNGIDGMSLRDYFAAKALDQAVLDYGRKNEHPHKTGDRLLPYECNGVGSRESIIARQAYRYADAMMEARKK